MAKFYSENQGINWYKLAYGVAGILFVLIAFWAIENAYMSFKIGNISKLICNGILMFICGFGIEYSVNSFNRERIINHSYELTKQTLAGLPNEYSVFDNISIGGIEFDHIVVGRNGIFVIVNRSVKGTVYANLKGSSWEIRKTGRGGTGYASGMKNPLKILNKQIFTLVDLLRKNGINIWIDGCVYFSGADTDLRDAPNKVFDNQSDFLRFILEYEPKKYIEPSDISKTKNILKNLQ